jgi:hypothetical protein
MCVKLRRGDVSLTPQIYGFTARPQPLGTGLQVTLE